MVHAVDGATGDALGEVRVYRHVFGFFRFFPGKKFVSLGPSQRFSGPLDLVSQKLPSKVFPSPTETQSLPSGPKSAQSIE
jgi:hypothetical protein